MNGDVRDFVDRIHYGDELVFMYRGQKFFLEGLFQDDNKFTTYLDRWELPGTDYIWVGKGDNLPCAGISDGQTLGWKNLLGSGV